MKFGRILLTGSASVLFFAYPARTGATPVAWSRNFATSIAIPDADATGIADTQVISMPGADSITGLQVSLRISGGFNGDYYAYLRHGATGFAVLLNRTGVSSSDPFGYSDSGFDITLSDSAANGDIHLYRTVSDPAGGVLTGAWQPDGRNIDPSLVSDSTSRTATLNDFSGLDPNGDWTLFISDNSAFGIGTLLGWGLSITADSNPGASVPEGGSTLALLMLGAAGLFAPFGTLKRFRLFLRE
jgi:subtilisin-like proprotein convertase family protein